jgi:Holliday junction resolvase RusA-like endonuclease
MYLSQSAVDWKEQAGWEIKRQWKKKPLEGKVELIIRWFFARERDISSGLKLTEDLLQEIRVYVNDSQIYHEEMWKDFDKKNPRVEIEIASIL